jgi:hypothetical protein
VGAEKGRDVGKNRKKCVALTKGRDGGFYRWTVVETER